MEVAVYRRMDYALLLAAVLFTYGIVCAAYLSVYGIAEFLVALRRR